MVFSRGVKKSSVAAFLLRFLTASALNEVADLVAFPTPNADAPAVRPYQKICREEGRDASPRRPPKFGRARIAAVPLRG